MVVERQLPNNPIKPKIKHVTLSDQHERENDKVYTYLRKNAATLRYNGKTIGAASLAKLPKVAQRSHWGDVGASWNSEAFADVSLAVAYDLSDELSWHSSPSVGVCASLAVVDSDWVTVSSVS